MRAIDGDAMIDRLKEWDTKDKTDKALYNFTLNRINEQPTIQPDKDKVSDLLYHIYSIQSPHLDMCGVIAKKYYCKELWEELFGRESELPWWMS